MRSDGDRPQEVLDLHPLVARVFDALRTEFAVPEFYPLRLDDVDHPPAPEDGVVEVAAFAMCHLKVVRRYAAPAGEWDTHQLVRVLTIVVRALDELTAHAGDQRALLLLARDRLHEAAWAVARDTGGPGLFDPR